MSKTQIIDLIAALKASKRPCATCGHPWNRHHKHGAKDVCGECDCSGFTEAAQPTEGDE